MTEGPVDTSAELARAILRRMEELHKITEELKSAAIAHERRGSEYDRGCSAGIRYAIRSLGLMKEDE